ncbi:MAG: hypothetical protein MUF84_12580 [Anaerolineae bacterium]|nr:hypothetical protein [Anaerolineae bacterium]
MVRLATIAAELEAMLNRPALFDEAELGSRSVAIDFLGFAGGSIRAYARSHGSTPETEHLLDQTTRLGNELRAVDRAFFGRVREQIRSGELTRRELRALCDRFTGYEPRKTAHLHLSLDPLDTLVAGVLHEVPPAKPTFPLEPEMIAYQPSPASAVLELVDRAQIGLEDVFYDLGSGLGDVVLLVNLLTGARSRGVEVDSVLCDYARDRARSFRLTDVTFTNADVRATDLSDGTVFYLFTPFTGDILTEVLAALHRVAGQRRIRIATYGPMTAFVAGLPWLTSLNDHREDPFRLAVLNSSTPSS